MRGDGGLGDAARIGAGRMQKGAAGATRAVDDLFVEKEDIVGVVVVLLADHIHETGPAMANADDVIALAQGAQRDAAHGGGDSGSVARAGEDAADALRGRDGSR